MQDLPMNLICHQRFETRELVTDFPSQLHDGNKIVVYDIACPPEVVPARSRA